MGSPVVDTYVYGAGGHGKVVADAALRAGMEVRGFVDDGAAAQGRQVLDLPIFGGWAWLSKEAQSRHLQVVLGIGDNTIRAKVARRCEAAGLPLVTLFHPTAVIAHSAAIEAGSVVLAGAILNPDSRVGRGAIVNTAAVVEHDVVIGDFAHLSPNATTGGAAQVLAFAHVGVGACLLPGTTVGERTIVGGGAAVVKDLPADVVAYGIPARVMRSRLPDPHR